MTNEPENCDYSPANTKFPVKGEGHGDEQQIPDDPKVKWEDGSTELFGKSGQEFYGEVDECGEPIKPRDDRQIWGTDEDSHLVTATDSVRQTLAEKRQKGAKVRAQRQAEQAAREADPVYQKRQADLKRYAELLQAVSGSVDNSWSNQTNCRIELENIPPDQMEDLIAAIRKVRK